MISTSKNQHTGSIFQELAWKKLGAAPQRLQSFEHHLIYWVKLRGSRSFNFERGISIWIHSNIFPGKRFWFYGNLTGYIRDLTGFIGPDTFGNEPAWQKKKEPANARTCRIHRSHLISDKRFWFYGNLTV